MGDAEWADLPSRVGDEPVIASPSVVVVVVRHASDVDHLDDGEFKVGLQVRSGAEAVMPCFEGTILLGSGRLSIGDVDHEDVLPVAPGRYRLQIETAPADHPEHVTIWLTPTNGNVSG